jgi:cytochrome c biogenesis protein CcdA/thiol-disulfide isomerase/thioredoxin
VLVLIAVGLAAGFVSAISPCVLPVLPVVLAGGASGRKPLRIIAGLVASFVVFTLFAAWLLDALGLPDDLLRNIAIALLFLLAATLLFPPAGLWLEKPFARLTRFRAGGGGFLLGASLGLVFVPCAGPALGAIASSAARHHFGGRLFVLTLAYAVGVAVPLLLIAYGGQGVGRRLRAEGPRLRFVSGLLIGVVALAITFNLDTRLQTALPGYTDALQKPLEDSGTARKELAKVTGATQRQPQATPAPPALGGGGVKLPVYGVAPPLSPGGRWFNSRPLTLAGLRGKVVLVDFWTYSCINCLRTLPHLEAWYRTYHRDGFEIIGVHTPEFAFEHVASNVGAAVERLGIRYPVVQDNDYATWTNYSNNYWPAHYLIDRQGRIRDYNFGEGGYATTEAAIKTLLGVDADSAALPDTTPTEERTPESYLGFERIDASRYVGAPIARDRFKTYSGAVSIRPDAFAYSGAWRVEGQRIVAGRDAALTLHFRAQDIYLVLGGRGTVGVSVGGKPARTVRVDAYKLYTLRSSATLADSRLDLRFSPGVEAYAFTFG